MRFVVFGAGAIGGVVGARLHQSGHDVVLVARGPHFDAIARRGLRVESPSGAVTLSIPVVDDGADVDLRPDDVVLLAVKSQDTAAALDALGAAPPPTAIVCLQNGVANERTALRRFAHVHGAAVMCPAGHLEPGVVIAYSEPVTGLIDVGRYPGGHDPTTEAVAVALTSSTFSSEVRDDIMRWKWAKLLMNLGNAVEALCGPSGRQGPLARRVREEGVACLRAAGIDFASTDEDRARRADLLRLAPVGGQSRPGGSSWQSLSRRTGHIETDYLNGEIVLLGRLHGVATPANELLQRRAKQMAAGGAPPGTVNPDELLAELDRAESRQA